MLRIVIFLLLHWFASGWIDALLLHKNLYSLATQSQLRHFSLIFAKKNHNDRYIQHEERYILQRVVKEGDPTDLIDFLTVTLPDVSRKQTKLWLAHNSVAVNDETQSQFNFALVPGDFVSVQSTKSSSGSNRDTKSHSSQIRNDIRILYEDECIVAVDKPSGLPVKHTSKEKYSSGDEEDITNNVLYKINRILHKKKEKAIIAYDMDEDESGVLLLAKTDAISKVIRSNWQNTGQTYVVLCDGVPTVSQGTIRTAVHELGNDRIYNATSALLSNKNIFNISGSANTSSGNRRRVVKEAVLHYRILEATTSPPLASKIINRQYSLLELSMGTCYREQLRLQLPAIGCIVTGETKYGLASNPLRRLGIHMSELRLSHPDTRESLTISAPTPKSFLSYIDRSMDAVGVVPYATREAKSSALSDKNMSTPYLDNKDEEALTLAADGKIKVVSLADFLTSTSSTTDRQRPAEGGGNPKRRVTRSSSSAAISRKR